MKRITLILEQHTPLIHFQPNESGATLRVSEVKPRLDRFLLTLNGGGNYEDGKEKAMGKNWLIGNDGVALDYKMKIQAKDIFFEEFEKYSPLYFGNMGDNATDKQKSITQKDIKLIIISDHSNLFNSLLTKENISKFFIENNFGTRASKGFGCFELKKYNDKNISRNSDSISQYHFTLNTNDLEKVFSDIDLFYKTLRSGINHKGPNNVTTFYFKSLMFLYAKEKYDAAQWEKKTIKEHFPSITNHSYNITAQKEKECHIKQAEKENNNLNLNEQSEDFRNVPLPLYYSNEKKLLFKDLLGLSSMETWMSYNRTQISKSNEKFNRIPSPLLFKIYKNKNNEYDVYILIKEDVVAVIKKNVLNKEMTINSSKDIDSDSLILNFPDEFDYNDFLKFAINKVGTSDDLKNYVRNDSYEERSNFSVLKGIYSSLKSNLEKKQK